MNLHPQLDNNFQKHMKELFEGIPLPFFLGRPENPIQRDEGSASDVDEGEVKPSLALQEQAPASSEVSPASQIVRWRLEIPEAPPGLSGSKEEQTIALAHMLRNLRIDFVCATLLQAFSRQLQEEGGQQALGALNVVRETRAAQNFLSTYPYFFTRIDRMIYAEARKRGYQGVRPLLWTT